MEKKEEKKKRCNSYNRSSQIVQRRVPSKLLNQHAFYTTRRAVFS